jgi:hypothetical protein
MQGFPLDYVVMVVQQGYLSDDDDDDDDELQPRGNTKLMMVMMSYIRK